MDFRSRKAYTLIEVIVALALLVSLTIIFLPIGINQLQANRVEEEVVRLISQMRELQQRANSSDTSFGVAFNTNSYTIYEGDSLATATNTDERNLPGDVSFQNETFSDSGNEIIFPSNSLIPPVDGTIEIGNSVTTYTITINEEGFINFNEN